VLERQTSEVSETSEVLGSDFPEQTLTSIHGPHPSFCWRPASGSGLKGKTCKICFDCRRHLFHAKLRLRFHDPTIHKLLLANSASSGNETQRCESSRGTPHPTVAAAEAYAVSRIGRAKALGRRPRCWGRFPASHQAARLRLHATAVKLCCKAVFFNPR
jgi:hypothetical protein